MPFCVGLTGGIGCGKSKATDIFAELGAGVVDTDVISRELTGPGGGAMQAVAKEFGQGYVLSDGSLDRPRMRALVFNDAAAKQKLETILHPLIRAASRERITSAPEAYVIVVVPLLLETGAYRDLVDRVLVIDCDEAQQVARTMARSGLTEDEVRRIMRAQVPRAARLKGADDVLHNDADIHALRTQVEALHAQYLAAARNAV
ncbi:MAG: dephospho-CoA kinase [Burkholderiales bacterium]